MQINLKKIWGLSIILLITIVLSSCTSAPTQIGVMDMEKVLNKSDRAAALRKELTEIGNELESNYQKKEEEMSSDKQKEEQERIYQEFVDNKQQLEDKLNKEINQVLDKISKEKNIDIILYKKGVHHGGMDVTDEVIERLDNQKSGEGAENESGE